MAAALAKTPSLFFAVRPTPLLQAVAGSVTAALLIAAALVSSRSSEPFAAARVLSLWAMGAAIVPMTFTNAHENHFFLAAALLILVYAISHCKRLAVVLTCFLFVQAVNLFLDYGFGHNHLSAAGWVKGAIHDYRTRTGWAIAVAILSVAVFIPLSIRTVRAVRAGLSVGITRP